jgi:hypothetical protein
MHASPQRQEPRLLGDPGLRIGGVAQDEQVERIGRAGVAQRFPDRLESRHDARRRFVVGRHQQRRPRRELRQRRVGSRAETAAAARHQRAEAGQSAGERQGDPGEQREEQREHEDRQRRHAIGREHEIHLVHAFDGQRDRTADHDEPPQPNCTRRAGRSRRARRRSTQRLRRHRKRRLVGQRAEGGCVQAVHR